MSAYLQIPARTSTLKSVAVRRGKADLVRIALLFFALMVGGIAFTPSASASTYSLPRVNIQAQVAENGDLYVTEGRTFAFEDDANGVFWNIPLSTNQQGVASTVSVLGVSACDGAFESEAEARRSARPLSAVSSADPGDVDVYTVGNDGGSLNLKVFMPSADGDESTVWVSYVIRGAVMSWSDTAELYWQFIGSEWEEDAEDVRLSVTFAGAGKGPSAVTGSDVANFRAWGHGPLDGVVSLDVDDPSNPSVTLTAPVVRSGQFAEVRVAFPADWVPSLQPVSDARLDAIMDEEAQWAEEANARRETARVVSAAGTVALTFLPVALLVTSIFLRKTRFASPRPAFSETYFRDLPSQDHPAVLSALVYGGKVEDCAFVATIMKLADDRVIEVAHESREENRFLGLGKKKAEVYKLRLRDCERAKDPIDHAVLKLYFGPLPQNGDEVDFDSFKESDHVGKYIEDFKDEVLAELERRRLTNLVPDSFKIFVVLLASVLVLAGLIFIIFTDGVNLPWILAGMALSCASAFVALTAKCYSQEAVELLNRCNALERWLEDFTNLDEAVPDDLILWNKMLVLAVAFGVSADILRDLASAVPAERRMNDDGSYAYPIYWWCYAHGGIGSPMGEMSDAYRDTVRALSSSQASSSGGFGGGFSGGGGGGVGGGGGGTF